MANIRLPLWIFALVGFAGVILLANYVQAQFEEVTAIEDVSSYEISTSIPAGVNIPKSEKVLIDKWIGENNLNTYGDEQGTVYAGGNPLFSEVSGKTSDRYSYIVKNHSSKPWKVTKPVSGSID